MLLSDLLSCDFSFPLSNSYFIYVFSFTGLDFSFLLPYFASGDYVFHVFLPLPVAGLVFMVLFQPS